MRRSLKYSSFLASEKLLKTEIKYLKLFNVIETLTKVNPSITNYIAMKLFKLLKLVILKLIAATDSEK